MYSTASLNQASVSAKHQGLHHFEDLKVAMSLRARRVGKSYLVTEVYNGKIAFTAVGTYVKDRDKDYVTYRKLQLEHFYDALLFARLDPSRKKPESWREAFVLLRVLLDGLPVKRKVVFIDELPWLAGPQSAEFVSELGYFWNSWACDFWCKCWRDPLLD